MIQIIGSVVVVGCVVGAFSYRGRLLLLWHPSEIMIIVGAAFGAAVRDRGSAVFAAARAISRRTADRHHRRGFQGRRGRTRTASDRGYLRFSGARAERAGAIALRADGAARRPGCARTGCDLSRRPCDEQHRRRLTLVTELRRALGLDIDVAINLSASDILDPQLGDEVLRCLERHGIAPTKLLLEITESAVMCDPVLAARHMQLLRVAGVRIAMDDFGTGYCSLSQLSRLPVDELKIDRSLIAHSYARPDDAMIVTSTIELAHSMGLRVVAEGVEDIEAWNFLRRSGCDLAQGFLISKPLPPQEVMAFISRANRLLQDSDSTQLQLRALEQLAATGR